MPRPANRSEQWPDHNAIRVGDDLTVTYHGQVVGRLRVNGRTWADGQPIYEVGGWPCYTLAGAAYSLVTRHLRGKP
jgi:hypothetical protein